MPNYRETTINGTSWVRCNHIIIDNPYQMTPRISMYEQQVVNVGGQNLITPPPTQQPIVVDFDPAASFPIIDPETGEPVTDGGTPVTVTHLDVYKVLFSLYMDAARRRDHAAA